jgi:aminodeoxyfutalosine deaminase
MTAYRCRTLVTMDGDPIDHGAFIVEGNRFGAVGPARDVLRTHTGSIKDLGDVIVLPGLINAHCHLDYTLMRGALLSPGSFPQWVQRINALKRSFSDEDYLRATMMGLEELRRFGVTSVLDIIATPQIFPRLPPPRIRTWFFLELIDVRPHPWVDEHAFGSWLFFTEEKPALAGFGLSPHAPYTASPGLYQAALECSRAFGMPVTTHVAESKEEYQMFADGRGELFDFLAKIGRHTEDCGKRSPLRHLLEDQLVGSDSILVHLNELDPTDLELLSAPQWRGLSIVHCPKSHRFLHHRRFPLEALRKLSLNICLGTDSLASNDSLSLFSEMRAAKRIYPDLHPKTLLHMSTLNPARALKQDHCLGKIGSGYLADAIAIPSDKGAAEAYEVIMETKDPIQWMMIDGKVF